MQQANIILSNPSQEFLPPLPKTEKIKKEENVFLGKKINNDADLISWLSGKDINQKTVEERLVPYELNFKVKKKMRTKLIKNAKKCELYFVQNHQNKEYINIKCIYCLKDIFNHNELLKFTNFEEFVYYLKYIFYLSDKVFSYSLANFKNNKKDSDLLFSKFESKEENWKFNRDKIICKLCIFNLINKPNFIDKIKEIFLEGKNEMGIIESDELVVEINNGEKYNENEENKKKNINKIRRNRINIPNNINNYSSNNINININNSNIINNNFNNYNNDGDILFYQSFYNLYEKIRNNPRENMKPEEINFFLYQMFCINHNKIIDYCTQIQNEMDIILYYSKDAINEDHNIENAKRIIIQQSSNQVLYLLNEIIKLINITNDCLIQYQNEYSSYFANAFQIFFNIINHNEKNLDGVKDIVSKFLFAAKLYIFA